MLTQTRIRELLNYNELSGEFVRKIALCNKVKVGQVAGNIHHSGYIHISVDGKKYSAHRLVWLYVYGEFPECEIDHINEDKTDNRLQNLRLASRKQNSENVSMKRTNTSGYRGVSYYKLNNKYGANVCSNGERFFLGLYDTAEAADEVVRNKRNELFTHNRD